MIISNSFFPLFQELSSPLRGTKSAIIFLSLNKEVPCESFRIWVQLGLRMNQGQTLPGTHLLVIEHCGKPMLGILLSATLFFWRNVIPGLGYESGGYVPFLTESLPIHMLARSLISSEAWIK